MANRNISLNPDQDQRKRGKMRNPDNLEEKTKRSAKKSKNGKRGLEGIENNIHDEEISYAFEYESKEVDPDYLNKKGLNGEFDDNQDIQYSDKEVEEFKSLKNIFVNRKQFKHLAMLNSPAYKLKLKEKERQKIKNSKSKFKKGNGVGAQKDSSFNKGIDGSTIHGDEETVDEDESMEEIDPRVFKAHGKTLRF